MTYEQLLDNITESAVDGVLLAFWEDTLDLTAIEEDIRAVLHMHLVNATPLQTAQPATLATGAA